MSNYEEIPASFIEHVKEALEKLYDFQALQENPLTQNLESRRSEARTPGAHKLRSHVIDAIESLNPGQNVAAHSGTVRVYNLIYMHYVGRLTIQQAAWEVGVSLRQAYRDLRRGQELVSAVLWHKFQADALHAEALQAEALQTDTLRAEALHAASRQADPPNVRQDTSVSAELTRLEDNTSIAALQDLLDAVIRPIHILADKYAVPIHMDAPAEPVLLTTNHTIAQQILTYLLSQIIQQAKPTSLNIQLFNDSSFIRVHYESDSESHANLHIEPIIQQMMEQIRWELHIQAREGVHEIALKSSQRRALLLVIDDNEGLLHLLQRYLTEDTYSVMSVPNTEQGLEVIPQLQPDVILLDVMMPGMDGWEVLQRIRTRSETKSIPVIICSVINDPELAFALGASHHVSKPVTRESLLLALQSLQL